MSMLLIDRELANLIHQREHQELYGCDTRDGSEYLIQTAQDFNAIYNSESTDIEFGIEGELFGKPYPEK